MALPKAMALYDARGRRLDATVHALAWRTQAEHRSKKFDASVPAEIEVPAEVDIVDHPVLFGGCLFKHYGHFLVDSMARLWARDLYPQLPILFTTDPRWHRYFAASVEIFSALNVFDRVLRVERPTMFRRLICPAPSFDYRTKVFSVADEPHTQVAQARSCASGQAWPRPVYLSRSGLSDKQRRFQTETELERELGKRGFEIVRPEILEVPDQISLFEQAPLLVGTVGSALHTVLFSRRPATKLAILNWGRGFENFIMIDKLKGNETHYVRSIHRSAETNEFELDVGQTLGLLEQAGLVPPS